MDFLDPPMETNLHWKALFQIIDVRLFNVVFFFLQGSRIFYLMQALPRHSR